MQLSDTKAITVYGPEAERSGLIPWLDRYIAAQTGLTPLERFRVMHNERSVTQFFGLTDSNGGRHWPLVVELFDGRFACVTVWGGRDALFALQNIKGATQPVHAAENTIRRRFWCDNPVCNLIHVSDDPGVMQEEASLLRSIEVPRANLASGLLDIGTRGVSIRHSGLWEFSKLLARYAGPKRPQPALAHDGHAHRSAKLLIDYIMRISRVLPDGLAALAQDWLKGYPASIDDMTAEFPHLSPWQRLILRCSLHSNPLWMKAVAIQERQDHRAETHASGIGL
jgi:nucleoside diphosphate kinase